MNEACPNENRHTGNTSIAVSPPGHRLSAQKPDKPVLATHSLRIGGRKGRILLPSSTIFHAITLLYAGINAGFSEIYTKKIL